MFQFLRFDHVSSGVAPEKGGKPARNLRSLLAFGEGAREAEGKREEGGETHSKRMQPRDQ